MSVKQRADYKWLVFFAVGMGTFMAVVDHGSVNVALPTIASHFNTDIATVQWVSLGYALGISALLLPAGRLADQFGRKEVYAAGFVLFGLSSILAGSSPNLWFLIAFKISSAVGAAMIMANGLAILTAVFPANERGKVLGTHMAFVGSGSIFGPVLGGLLVSTLGWRYVFFINLPLALFGLALALLFLNRRQLSQQENGRRGSFDWMGACLSSGALIIFLMGMTNGHRVGWGSPVIVIALTAAVVLLGLFLWRETRAASPMLDLGLFKSQTFSFGALAGFTAFLASGSIFFLMPFYLQKVLGYSPGESGLIMVSSAACMALMGPVAGRMSDRFGWRPFNVGGAALTTAGVFLIATLSVDSSVGLIIAALILHGLGGGMFYATNYSAVLSAVSPSKYGIASAFLNLNRNTASTTGLAIATTIVVGTMASMGFEPSLDAVTGSAGAGAANAFVTGMRNVFLMAGGLMILVIAISAFGMKQEKMPTEAEAVAEPIIEEAREAPQGTPD